MARSYRKRAPVGPYPSKAQVTLGLLIEERRLSLQEFGAALGGVRAPTVCEWRSAWARPNDNNKERVAEWSRGRDPLGNPVGEPRIPVEDWDIPPDGLVRAEEAA
jgi:hypothetical protein